MSKNEPLNPHSTTSGTEDAPPLTPQRWQQIKELFGSALEQDASKRLAFLGRACSGDEDLRAEVLSLLASADDGRAATSEVFRGVSPQPAERVPEEDDPMLGRRVGDYRIDRRIGYGGMAAVYLASRADDQFHMEVAVKVLRPDLDRAELSRRFLNERQTLAALDHPNIVKLLDGGATDEGLPYLVMDYVEGKPIDEYCDSRRLSIQQRLQLFCKVCEGVQFAHQHRVIHRDLKPNNILVADDGTPKLLDFGIAKVLDPEGPSEATITRTATRHLTPAYASPEQVRGEKSSAATDVYSLSVVLYELLSGHRPYRLEQRTPAAMERAICEQEPESPSIAVDRVETETHSDGTVVTVTSETVSRTRERQVDKLRHSLKGDLDNIVLKGLQKEPQRRYQSVDELAHDIQQHLEHRPVQARPSTLAYRVSKLVRRRKTEAIAVATVVAVVAGSMVFSIWYERNAAERTRAELGLERTGGRRTIAVLGFKNISGRTNLDWLSTALSEMLTAELAAGGKLRIIPGDNVAQTSLALSLDDTDSFSASSLRQIYKNLGSDYLVVGSYFEEGENLDQIRLNLRLLDALRGKTIVVTTEKGLKTDLSAFVARAGSSLREKLGLTVPTPGEASSIQAALPSSAEAAEYYAEGLRKQRVYDVLAARELFEKAVMADPNFALAHLALSDAWSANGKPQRAQDEAKKAFDLSAGLPREQSLMIEARYYETLHQWDKAIEIRRTLFNFFPDNLDHGLQLMSVQAAGARGQDSLATLELLRKLPVPERNDPRIDLAEAATANVVSDYKRQAAAAQLAAQKARLIGARLLVARARAIEARAYMDLGQKDKVGPTLNEARDIYAAVGDRFHEARVLQSVGLAFYYQGKLEDAKKTYLEALSIQRELGSRANEAKLLNGIAMVLHQQNDVGAAQQDYFQALAICREIDDRAMTGTVLGNLAGIEVELGKFQDARAHLQESLDISRRVGEQSAIAVQLQNLAIVLVEEGDLRGAGPLYEEAFQISRKTGKNRDLTSILMDRGDLQLAMGQLAAALSSYQEAQRLSVAAGDQLFKSVATRSIGGIQLERAELGAARTSFEQAMSNFEKIGDIRYVQEARMALAALDLEDSHPADAEHGARLAMEECRKINFPDPLARAEVLLAQALLAQHRAEEARATSEDAVKVAAKGGSLATQIEASSVAAEVQIAGGKPAEAANSLTHLVAQSHKSGIVLKEFRARLALGEAEIRVGRVAKGKALLDSLEHDATAKGFLLISGKALRARTKYH